MYRAGLESILGFKLRGERLRIAPCIPRSWREFEITYTITAPENQPGAPTVYAIKVENPKGLSSGIESMELDGVLQREREVVLVRDGRRHNLRVVLGLDMNAVR
jgi:cyclic beta-1,2-glucan synthetase